MNRPVNGLRAYRERNGLTQEQFATRAGLFQSVVSRLENAEHLPSPKVAEKIERATGGAFTFKDLVLGNYLPARVAKKLRRVRERGPKPKSTRCTTRVAGGSR